MTEHKTVVAAHLPDRQLALSWAREHLDVEDCERITSRPWAKTYRVNHADGKAYLKILTPVLSRAAATAEKMAMRFPETVPSTIATELTHGFILSADHGGRDFRRDPGEQRRIRLLSGYADIQARCMRDEELLDGLIPLDTGSLITELLAFLSVDSVPSKLEGATVPASYFLSESRCRHYRDLFSERSEILQRYIEGCTSLPDTINHCDLRPSNAAEDSSGALKLYDWDEAVRGPAGLSLHAMFSGCTRLLHALDERNTWIDPESLRQTRRELDAYLDALASGEYTRKSELKRAVGPAAVAGMIYYIIGFSRFPKDSRSYKNTVRGNIKKRLSDLLDVCDYLSVNEDDSVLEFARNYSSSSRGWRAERMLSAHLGMHADDVDASLLLGKLQRDRGRVSRSIRTLRQGLEEVPDNAACLAELGASYAFDGDYTRAIRHLRRSLAQQESETNLARLEEVIQLDRLYREADRKGTVPTVDFTDQEQRDGATPPKRKLCEMLFRRHGTLLMKNVFDTKLLGQCHDTFVERYRSYLTNSKHSDALRIGDKRFQITMDMAPPYSSPDLYGNAVIVPLMRRLVGKECTLGAFVSAMSLPGSEDQRLHKDHKNLFVDDPEVKSLPPFAVTVMVPLVDLNEHVGTTRIKKGSHRLDSASSRGQPYQTPFASVGDCYLMDYRLSHHGQANRSDKPRPILSMLYQRPWFHDYINFTHQPSLRLSREEFDKVPKKLQGLLSWTNEPGPR